MREELERVKVRLRENREFAEITVSREGQNLTAWTNLTAIEITEAVREAYLVLSGQIGSNGKKVYRNEEAGFEIDIPEEWLLPTKGAQNSIECLPDEAIDFAIGPLLTERLPDYTEREFTQYIQEKGYTNLQFGRIFVGGSEQVWARYHRGGGEWEKKYMLAFGGIAYFITTTGANLTTFTCREKIWDTMVASFRLSESRRQDIGKQRTHGGEIAGQLYEKAYEAVTEGRHSEARALLEQCLHDDPDHILAHKELAVVLKKMGDMRGALSHRREVKRLDPSDTVNRFNLAVLFAVLGARDDALLEAEELLTMEPYNPRFLELRKVLYGHSLTYPQHYDEESRQQPGEKRNLKLTKSIVLDSQHLTSLILVYQWDEQLPSEEARSLTHRAIAYVACAVYDAATSAGLSCQASKIPNGRRPAWILEGERAPVSLTLSDIDESDRTCQMTVSTVVMAVGIQSSGRTHWDKLHAGFKARFSDIYV